MPKNNDILTLFSQLTCGDLNGGCFKLDDYVYVHNGHLIIKIKSKFFDNLPNGMFYFKRRTIVEGKNPNCYIENPITLTLSTLYDFDFNVKKKTPLGVFAIRKGDSYIDVANTIALLVACNFSEGFIDIRYLTIISKIISKLIKNNELDSIIFEPFLCYKDKSLLLKSLDNTIKVLVMFMTCCQ